MAAPKLIPDILIIHRSIPLGSNRPAWQLTGVAGSGRPSGRKFPDIATADAADILRDESRGSDWQGDRGRSVRRKPIPLSSKSSKTGAFGRRFCEREPAEAEMLRLGTRKAR